MGPLVAGVAHTNPTPQIKSPKQQCILLCFWFSRFSHTHCWKVVLNTLGEHTHTHTQPQEETQQQGGRRQITRKK